MPKMLLKEEKLLCETYFVLVFFPYIRFRDAGEGGQEGASTPPAFWLGEQGEQECPL